MVVSCLIKRHIARFLMIVFDSASSLFAFLWIWSFWRKKIVVFLAAPWLPLFSEFSRPRGYYKYCRSTYNNCNCCSQILKTNQSKTQINTLRKIKKKRKKNIINCNLSVIWQRYDSSFATALQANNDSKLISIVQFLKQRFQIWPVSFGFIIREV